MMQLFWTPYSIKGEQIVIRDGAILDQLKKVLRLKKGDTIYIQNPESKSSEQVRHCIQIDDWDHQAIYGTIKQTQTSIPDTGPKVTMYVAMPNKWDKAELIAQKLTEIGVNNIIFWVAHRSVLSQYNEKKRERIHKIIKEASEQSWGRILPSLVFCEDKEWKIADEVVIFDTQQHQGMGVGPKNPAICIGVIGPEGGLTQKDYTHFPNYVVSSLGNTILRMETAAIVAAWALKTTIQTH